MQIFVKDKYFLPQTQNKTLMGSRNLLQASFKCKPGLAQILLIPQW